MPRVGLAPATIYGRYLVEDAPDGPGGPLLVGFHGYAQHAGEHLADLRRIPLPRTWTRVAVQALHRFYRSRSEVTVASWMTGEDRERMIATNIEYVNAVLDAVGASQVPAIVSLGFSQGTATAFRAAARGRFRVSAVVAIGGDVPPELLEDAQVRFPPVLLARGRSDGWYTQEHLDADRAALRTRGGAVHALVYDGGHEWTEAVASAAAEFMSSL